MNKWKILLPLETSSRETIYKIHLANKLTDSGLECYIGKKKEIYNLCRKS